jgi:hypothetical protein
VIEVLPRRLDQAVAGACHLLSGLRLEDQPFYAFPWPDWSGNLAAVAMTKARPVTELAFARSGPTWWFAEWMVVLTTAQVAAVLHKQLTAHGSRTRGKKERLVRFDLSHSMVKPPKWGSGATPPQAIGWREFWTTREQCGDAGWPQLIRFWARADPRSFREAHRRGSLSPEATTNGICIRMVESNGYLPDQDTDSR